MAQKVILVDANDKKIGLEEKMKAHREGKRHRAISVYVFNSKGQLLMQRRAKNVYHSGLKWSNTCCSNCYDGETTQQSAHRSLKGEMGFDCKIKEQFSTIYKTKVGAGLTEHEYLHIFFGIYNKDPKINPNEVNAWKWVSIDAMAKDARKHPYKYSNWLKILLRGELYKKMGHYTKIQNNR